MHDNVLLKSKISLNKKEWICSLFKEWLLEKSEIRVNLEWTFVLFTHFGVTSGSLNAGIPEVTPKWVNNTNVHSKFTLISLFSKIHSLKSEHIHSFLFRDILHQINIRSISCLQYTRWIYADRIREIIIIRSGSYNTLAVVSDEFNLLNLTGVVFISNSHG